MIIAANPPAQALLLDSRSPNEFAQGHLEGALNVDLSSFRARLRTEEELNGLEQALADLNGRLGASADRPVVVYDAGFNTRLAKTAFMMALSGLEVYLWPQGWEAQATHQTPVPPTPTPPWAILNRSILLTAGEMLSQNPIVDVREPNEFAAGHLPKAKNLPLKQFYQPEILEQLGVAPQQTVALHCRSGARSAAAFWLLRHHGQQAKNYLGSMLEWEAEGDLPIERP